jgi:hypothetical protein
MSRGCTKLTLEDRMSGALQHFAPLADAADEQTALQEIRARWMDWVARNHQALIPLSRSKAIDPGRRRN